MKTFTSVRGKAVPFLLDDLDTDQIAPASLMRTLTPDYKTAMFGHRRAAALSAGQPLPFDSPVYAGAPILVTGKNFGCGSAREVAVWALAENGVRCIVAPSFSAVFRESCLKNGILPVRLDAEPYAAFAALCAHNAGRDDFCADLQSQSLATPDGAHVRFAFDPQERDALLTGLDDVSATMRYCDAIDAWERRCAQTSPWLRKALIPSRA
jgi:3-isopropylmalate/(R)-2-methylmalate dehydratase small subunit